MNKATKYALNGAGIGGLGGIIFSVIKQFSEMNDNPNLKFDLRKMFETGLKGAAIGGATGLAIGVITDWQNENEEPINTDAFLYTVVNEVKLNKSDEKYKRLSKKADFLSNLVSNEFSDKLCSSPIRLGSTEKGTALRDKFDIDIFFSFKSNSFTSNEKMFQSVLEFLEEQVDKNGILKIRNQNKSIGVLFEIQGEGYKIDIVPCKITQSNTGNTSGYLYLNNTSFFGKSSYTKTDIKVIKGVKLTETQKKIVIILKHWKKKNNLPISSYLLESYVLDAYSFYKYKIPKSITKKVLMVLEHIKESIDSNIMRSVENTNNILTNISDNAKQQIIYACKSAIEDFSYQENSILEIFDFTQN
jgi:hypothetical protein